MEIVNLKKSDYIETRFNTSIALGNFDGIHIAHKEIISNNIETSKKMGLRSGVLLFDTHTRLTIEGKSPPIITSKKQKLKILEELGVDIVYIIEFDKNIMSLSPEDFIKEILLRKLNAKSICVGFDYKFGHKASGDITTLKKLGKMYEFNVTVIPPIYKKNIISSTKIRNFIKEGKIKSANNMLGRNYSILGKVVDGNKMGHELGFPTANLETKDNFVIPKNGIYESRIIISGTKYIGATSIGTNPTFQNNVLKIENHILDFNKNIYAEKIEVEFVRFIRDEIRFTNIEDLKKQIRKDVNDIKFRY
ncbi:MAG TPA: bifunctional riboflavin kinase/FAD synthetase [Tissierellaceae bacterium]|nr:bifunctional riboflavin kinase/FAD synthetase [Tissierellaceae bacterium]